jgi:hypothetical protein
VLAGCIVFLGGCGDSAALKEAREKDNIRTLARMYGQFMSSHRGNGPKNEQEFKQYLQGRREELAREEITDVDALLVSNRDGEPYVVVYGLVPTRSMTPSGRVVAYEKSGIDGKRMVAYETMAAEELDEARFQTVVSRK